MKKPNNENGNSQENKGTGLSVSRVKIWSNGATFNLHYGRCTIYKCRVVESDKGDFVAFPQELGKDGKYYSFAYIKLTEAEQKAIIHLVEQEAEREAE